MRPKRSTESNGRAESGLEQPLAGEHFVEHHAEGPDVGAFVYRLAFGLLGRHVGGGAEDHAGLGRGSGDGGRVIRLNHGRSAQLGEPEIQNLYRSFGRDLHVSRLQVAMHDSLLVRGFERIGDLPRDIDRFVERNGTLSDSVGQRRPFHQFHHQVIRPDVVEMADIVMVERRDGSRFLAEAIAELFGSDFDGYLAADARIAGAIDLSR